MTMLKVDKINSLIPGPAPVNTLNICINNSPATPNRHWKGRILRFFENFEAPMENYFASIQGHSMNQLRPVQLDEFNSYKLLPDELELFSASNVALYLGEDVKPKFEGGMAILTSFRIVYMNQAQAFDLDLPLIRQYESKAGFLTSSAKIFLYLARREEQRQANSNHQSSSATRWTCPACDEINEKDAFKCYLCGTLNPLSKSSAKIMQMPSSAADSPERVLVKLSFRSSGYTKFGEFLAKALEKKAWKDAELRAIAEHEARAFSPLVAGVSGLMRQAEEGRNRQIASQTEAFSDLDALMAKAAEMTRLAETISKKLSGSAKQENISESQDREFRELLLDLGLAGRLSSKTNKSAHHIELARQLCQFLVKLLDLRKVQMMSLSDIYCIYNRARGTDLVSPEDLFKAASQFEDLGLPVCLKSLSSGLLVVQNSAFSVEQVSGRIHAAIKESSSSVLTGHLTAFDLAVREGISAQLAMELLLACEAEGKLCRDQSTAGIAFYPNLILAPSTTSQS